MNDDSFAPDRSVLAHASVLEDGGWAGFVRHHESGELEFHPGADTIGEPLETVRLQSLLDADPSLRQLESLQAMAQAWRSEPNGEFQTSRLPSGPTHFFQIEVSPSDDHPEHATIGGAIVNCWIRMESESAAQDIVTRELSDTFWTIDSLEGPDIHTAEDYEDDPTDRKYYEQAQAYGEVMVFHEYPPED